MHEFLFFFGGSSNEDSKISDIHINGGYNNNYACVWNWVICVNNRIHNDLIDTFPKRFGPIFFEFLIYLSVSNFKTKGSIETHKETTDRIELM